MSEARRAPAPRPADPPEDGGALSLRAERWALVRDVLVFQAKMVLEGFRDLLLVPLTLGAGLWGLLFGGEHPARAFREALRLGRRFDRWLHLFAPLNSADARARRAEEYGRGLDEYVARLERKIVEDHERGGPSRSAAQALDDALSRLERLRRPRPPSP